MEFAALHTAYYVAYCAEVEHIYRNPFLSEDEKIELEQEARRNYRYRTSQAKKGNYDNLLP